MRLNRTSSGIESFETEARRQGLPLETHAFDDPEIVTMYEKSFVLVRPDGHVAWRGDELPADARDLIARVRGAN